MVAALKWRKWAWIARTELEFLQSSVHTYKTMTTSQNQETTNPSSSHNPNSTNPTTTTTTTSSSTLNQTPTSPGSTFTSLSTTTTGTSATTASSTITNASTKSHLLLQQQHRKKTLQKVIEQLSLSYFPSKLPGRQYLADDLKRNFLHLLQSEASGTAYLSGMPGTGKSVVLRWVLGFLEKKSEEYRKQMDALEEGMEPSADEDADPMDVDEDGDDAMMRDEDAAPSKTGNASLTEEEIDARIQKLQESDDYVPAFETIWINALKLNSPRDAYERIWDIMGHYTNPPSKRQYAQKLSHIFHGSKQVERPYFIIVIDEMDYLVTKSHDVIYELFNWPQQTGSRLLVIGIANTIDIKSKLPHKVASRIKDTESFVFQPYNHFELEEILLQRFGEHKKTLITDDAISYLCHRVASSSGDIRQLFAYASEVLQAKDTSFAYATKKRSRRRNKQGALITRSRVEKILDEIVEEYPPTDLPLYDQLFLICSVREEDPEDQNLPFDRVVIRCQTVLRKAAQKSGKDFYVPSIQQWWPVYRRLIGMQIIRENSLRSSKSNFPMFFLYGYATYQVEQLIELDTMKDFKEFLNPTGGDSLA